MIVRTHLLQCRSGGERDAFHGMLLRDATPIAAGIPGIRHYTVNAVFDASHRLRIISGAQHVDAITQMWFDGRADLAHAEAGSAYRQFDAMLRPMIRSGIALDVVQREFLAPPDGIAEGGTQLCVRRRLLKRMSLLQRAAALDAQAFQRIWEHDHGPRVAQRTDGLRGYLQDVVVDARVEVGERQPACDGLTELWFDDLAGMESVLPPISENPITGNAARFIERISTFLVREIELF